MIFNQPVVGLHPASSGYRLEFLCQGPQGTGFESGSGSFTVSFPKFSITGLDFNGKNRLFDPTGIDSDKISDVPLFVNEIFLDIFVSGDLDALGDRLASTNIKKIDIYSGDNSSFTPDTLGLTNLVQSNSVGITTDDDFLSFKISSGEINQRIEENIFYKAIPSDYLTFGEASQAVSGIMFGGFNPNKFIDETEVFISRTNAKDLEFGIDDNVVDIFNETTIILDPNMAIDFGAQFRLVEAQDVVVSGSGIDLLSSNLSIVNDGAGNPRKVTITGQALKTFEIDGLLDTNSNRIGFIVDEA